MVSFFGDYNTTETVYIPFNAFTSDDPSASATITNLANTDIHIHKDGSTTQRSSASGVTVSIDFDTITGNHLVSIDLSDNTDAGYYANGSTYQVRMEGTTIDGATVNAWIGAFSIGRMLRPTTAGRTLDVETGGCAGIDWGNIANKTTANDLSATDIQLCDTVSTLTGHTAQTGDSYARIGATGSGLTSLAAASVLGALDTAAKTGDPNSSTTIMGYTKQLVNVLIGTDGVTTFPAEAAPGNGVSLAEVIRAIHADVTGINGDAMRGTDSAALASVCTEARLAELDAANIPADLDSVLTDTGTTLDGKLDSLVVACITNATGADIATDIAGILGTDGQVLISTDAQDLSATLDVNTKTITADAIDSTSVDSTALDAVVMSDLAAVPSATASIVSAINWIFELSRNRLVTNGTNDELELYKDNAVTKLAEATISDDGTDFEREEWRAPT